MGSISKIKDLDFEFLFLRIFALIQLLWLWTVSAFSSSCSQDSLSLACAFSRLSFSPFLSPGSCFPFHFQIQSCFTSWLFSLVLWTLSKLLASFGQQAAQCVSTGHLPGASHSFLDGPWPLFWKGQGLPHSVHADNYSIVYVYHIFLTHSPVSGHLGCFHVLVIVNTAAINIGIHVSLWIVVFSGNMPSSRLLGHMVALFLVFKGISMLFSIVTVSIYQQKPAQF